MFITMMVSWVYVYVQTDQYVYITYVIFCIVMILKAEKTIFHCFIETQ